MSGTLSQATSEKYDRHQRTIERLDNSFIPFGLRFLLTLPEHKSILTNLRMTKGKRIGLRIAKNVLKALIDGTLYPESVRLLIQAEGETLIK